MSYKNILIGLVALFVVTAAVYLVATRSLSVHSDIVRPEIENLSSGTASIKDEVLGLMFSYDDSQNGYVLLPNTESTHPDFEKGWTLIHKPEYELFINSTDVREGPPTMNIKVYKNPGRQPASVWTQEYMAETNSSLARGSIVEATVQGAPGVQFIADGLYPINTYVVTQGNYLYVFQGSYLDTESAIYKDFIELITTVTFLPQNVGVAEAKLDPQVACESALIYMTFPSGAEAERFIGECVAGEYPEVIERYRSEINNNNGAAI